MWGHENEDDGPRPVRLNVYDLPDAPGTNVIGLGVYHSGTEIDGWEYAFGQVSTPGRTGVWENRPKMAGAFTYNRTVEMGNTAMSKEEVTHSSACMRRKCLHVSAGFGANPRPSKAASQI